VAPRSTKRKKKKKGKEHTGPESEGKRKGSFLVFAFCSTAVGGKKGKKKERGGLRTTQARKGKKACADSLRGGERKGGPAHPKERYLLS